MQKHKCNKNMSQNREFRLWLIIVDSCGHCGGSSSSSITDTINSSPIVCNHLLLFLRVFFLKCYKCVHTTLWEQKNFMQKHEWKLSLRDPQMSHLTMIIMKHSLITHLLMKLI